MPRQNASFGGNQPIATCSHRMILEHLSIVNYKNIREAELDFSAGVNCLVGKNGMGKTNLLDALYYLSFCKTMNGVNDSQAITRGEEYFMLQGHYQLADMPEDIRCGYRLRSKKSFKRGGKEYQRLSDHIGLLPIVMLTPADSILLQGGSEERRRFMDMVISQFNRPYLNALIRYNQALQQRNSLLKLSQTPGSTLVQMGMGESLTADPIVFQACEEQMDFYGQQLYAARRQFVDDFEPVFQHFYRQISMGREEVTLTYTSHFAEGQSLTSLLNAVRGRDLALGYTTRGAHKDELHFMLDGQPMKQIGSQGQNKTFLVGLKLAQFDFLRRMGHTTPILLLDDIFDRLDGDRVEQIIRLVAGSEFGQIFITDTNREYLDRIIDRCSDNYKLFGVEQGSYTVLAERV